MLNRLELLVSLLGAWIVAGIGYSIIKHKRRETLPKGAVIIEKEISGDENKKPGSRWVHIGMIIGMGSTTVLLILAVLLGVFNIWESTSGYIALNFPSWLNWIGIIGIWTSYGWGTLVMAYNVNYTPLFKPMRGKYTLASGGPYTIVRHPYYIGNAFEIFFIFLATGIWLSFIGLISIIVMPYQAKNEEEMLVELFGKSYEDYMVKTGRFFPKIKK